MAFNREWGLTWPDKVFSPFYMFLTTKPFDWPTWWRRFYLLFLPIAFPSVYILRWTILFVGFLSMGLALGMNYVYCVWHGQKSGLQK